MSSVDFHKLTEPQQLSFVGLQLALAAADGHVDAAELGLILECVDIERLSEDGRKTLRYWMLHPPDLELVLPELAAGPPELRYGVVVHLTDVALADEELVLSEQRLLREVREALRVSRTQQLAIEEFIWEVRRIRALGLSEDDEVRAVKEAASGLTAVAVPKAALLFSGSLLGLGKGALAGLAALGVGAAIPGVGVVVALGVLSFLTMRLVLDPGRVRAKERWDNETQARIQRRQRNLGHLTVGLRDWAQESEHPGLVKRLETFERMVLAELQARDPVRPEALSELVEAELVEAEQAPTEQAPSEAEE